MQQKPPNPEFNPLSIGPITVWPPVVLAPMAGITNYPFRNLCRQFGAGLYVSEMITARSLVEGNIKTQKIADFGPEETPRSLQLYGADPFYIAEATKRLVGEGRVDHIDLNFGCPVKKITRKGGGAAIPVRPNLLRRIVRAAVVNAGTIPVTIKFRIGIDEVYQTYKDAGRIAEEEGCAAVGLHARTAEEGYSGAARWEFIAELKQHVRHIPVLGNGDIWEAADALQMLHQTGCDGVIVGRGCLGKPWLFRDLVDAFKGNLARSAPNFGEIAAIMLQHAHMMCEWQGEVEAMIAFRKHASWYTKGFRSSTEFRTQLMRVSNIADLETLLHGRDPHEAFPDCALRVPRGKTGCRQKIVLPEGYLDDLTSDQPPHKDAEELSSGG